MTRALPHGEAFLFFSVSTPVRHSKFQFRRETAKLSVCKSAIIADLSQTHQCLTVYKDQTWQKPHEI